jgi:hypothetical protein
MKISELLVSSLMKTSLFEMAFVKKVAIDKARYLQNQIARHLVKIYMYSDSEYVRHWKNEVSTWLLDIQENKLKGTNKPLSYKELMLILFEEPLGTIDDIQVKMNRVYCEYTDLKINQHDPAMISRELAWLMPAVCKDISVGLFTRISKYETNS